MFKDRPAGQVVNREELIGYIGGVEYFDVTDACLEPDFLVVVLAALVYTGDITLSVVGRKYDSAGVSMLAAADVDDLINFKHIEQPKDWNIAGLKALFELVGLQSGYVSLVTQGKDDPVRELQAKLDTLVRQIVVNQNNIRSGMDFMGVDLLAVCGYRNAGCDLNKAKDFLEHMQNFNAPAKLKQFKPSAEEVSVFVPAVKMLNILGKLQEFYQSNNVLAAYLNSAELNLPADNMWISQLKEVRSDIVQQLSGVASAEDMLKILPAISQGNQELGLLLWKALILGTPENRLPVVTLQNSLGLYAFAMPDIYLDKQMLETAELDLICLGGNNDYLTV